jgi:hypothetical protein
MAMLLRAIEAGGSATIVERITGTLSFLRIRYSGPGATFEVDELRIGRDSCFASTGSIAAETLVVDWEGPVPAGTEILCRVRNVSATPATFVAVISGQ